MPGFTYGLVNAHFSVRLEGREGREIAPVSLQGALCTRVLALWPVHLVLRPCRQWKHSGLHGIHHQPLYSAISPRVLLR